MLDKTAGFDSECPKCHTAIKKGDKIYKVDDHWCINQTCPKTQSDLNLPDYAKVHSEIWQFAQLESEKVHPIKENEDSNAKKDRGILTQVIYKKCMDYVIHAKSESQ